jgi:hypothetical protein
VVTVTAVALLLLEPAGVLHLASTGLVAVPAQTDKFADFGGQIALIGYSAHLYWKAQSEIDINFQVFVHVLGPDGTLVAQSDKINPGEFPTKWWPPDRYVHDEHLLALPENMPPGTYRVTTGLWVQAEGWRLPLLEDGRQVGDNRELFTLTVEAK